MFKQTYSKKSVEALYYLLKNAVLDADLYYAEIYLGMLKEAYSQDKNFFKIFDKPRLEDFKLLKKQVRNKQLIQPLNNIGPIEKIEAFGNRAKEEVEIQNSLINQEFSNILELLKIDKYSWGGHEIPVNEGYVDIIIDQHNKENRIIRHLIELKAGVADHRVVGQIRKYEIHFLKKLNYKLWDDVQGVVVANGYSENALRELKKNNVITLVYQKLGNEFKYVRV